MEADHARSRWHWLADLVVKTAERPDVRFDALVDALDGLGYDAGDLVEGIATVLETTPGRLRAPDPQTVVGTQPIALATLLEAMLEVDNPAVGRIAEAWLRCPPVAYQVPAATLERWLVESGAPARIVAPRLVEEGLAMLGPDGLHRVARSTADHQVRQAAERWLSRLP